jgi:hypothetical protein
LKRCCNRFAQRICEIHYTNERFERLYNNKRIKTCQEQNKKIAQIAYFKKSIGWVDNTETVLRAKL